MWKGRDYISSLRDIAFFGPGKFRRVMRKAPKGGELDPTDFDINRIIAMGAPGAIIGSACSVASSVI